MAAIQTVSVVGVGLIGGSFALALRRLGYAGRIIGVSSPATIERALELSVIDRGLPLGEALPRSDLIYLSQPVPVIIDQLRTVRDLAPSHALVTDAGSTKRVILQRARELFGRGTADFVGGHPMAGKAGRGVQIADGRLFAGATYALVPARETMPETPVVAAFRAWLAAMGCRVRVMDADQHDRIVGWTSHLPQLVSTALAASIGEAVSDAGDLQVAGEGLRDMTRLAASPYEVWAGILETNPGPIDGALSAFIAEAEALRAALRKQGASPHFARGQQFRALLKSG